MLSAISTMTSCSLLTIYSGVQSDHDDKRADGTVSRVAQVRQHLDEARNETQAGTRRSWRLFFP